LIREQLKMQKLQVELKNAPRNASQVPCSASLQLNRVERPSVVDKVLAFNNPEVNHRQHTDGSDLRVLNIVYVLNQRGFPLMPTNQAKARRLLKERKAKVVKRFPFTVQLVVPTGEAKQKITFGIDSGFNNIGFSIVSETKELVSGTVK